MKELLAKIWFSSQDPTKISLTLKSIGAFAVSFGLFTQVDADTLEGSVVTLVTAITSAVSALTALWGFIRKFTPKK